MSSYRVYYEDTDLGGVVYHANYLKYAERARTDWLRTIGIDQSKLLIEEQLAFVVYHLEIDFIAPAKLDDILHVETELTELKKASMKMLQMITREGKKIANLHVSIACIDQHKKPARLPSKIKPSL